MKAGFVLLADSLAFILVGDFFPGSFIFSWVLCSLIMMAGWKYGLIANLIYLGLMFSPTQGIGTSMMGTTAYLWTMGGVVDKALAIALIPFWYFASVFVEYGVSMLLRAWMRSRGILTRMPF